MSDTVTIERTTPSSTQLRFVWHGGPYVDVFWGGGEVPDHVSVHHEGHDAPFTNINVWDYDTCAVGLEPGPDGDYRDALGEKADEWIAENREDYGL